MNKIIVLLQVPGTFPLLDATDRLHFDAALTEVIMQKETRLYFAELPFDVEKDFPEDCEKFGNWVMFTLETPQEKYAAWKAIDKFIAKQFYPAVQFKTDCHQVISIQHDTL